MTPTFAGLMRISAAATAFAVAAATPAFGHAHLSKSVPSAGTAVSAPNEILLIFTEPLEAAFSAIDIHDGTGKAIETDKVQVKDNVMRLPLKPPAPGRYTVNWHVLSVDTHKTNGNFTFTVKP